jgi:hypothetical protein
MPVSLPRALALLAACAIVGTGCGRATHTTTGASGPALPESEIPALNRADLKIFASANETGNLVGHPQAVKRARQLIKPLTVADTLNVKPSNQVAGGLVANLTSELDAITPGLTAGQGSNEHLDSQAVHRFLEFGSKDPTEVFRPTVVEGIDGLTRLLKGKPAETRVTSAGVDPAQTGRELIESDVRTTRRYWPDLAKRLEALEKSLRS